MPVHNIFVNAIYLELKEREKQELFNAREAENPRMAREFYGLVLSTLDEELCVLHGKEEFANRISRVEERKRRYGLEAPKHNPKTLRQRCLEAVTKHELELSGLPAAFVSQLRL